MSLNWVMLSPTESFTPLANETRIYNSPPRISLTLQTLNKYPGHEPFHLHSSTGHLHLTTLRIIYIPDTPTPQLQSFAAPLLNLHDSRVTAPFFGPNVCIALVQPVPGGGIPSVHPAVECRLVFKDGGAYDFHAAFVAIKERLAQAVDAAREQGQAGSVDMTSVHAEQLPAYDEGEVPVAAPAPVRPLDASQLGVARQRHEDSQTQIVGAPPEPPPGYEEAQMAGVERGLDRDTR